MAPTPASPHAAPTMSTEEAPAPTLALYHYDACPHCARVRDAIDTLGVEVAFRDVLAEPERRRELAHATGRATVPVLRIERADGEVEWMPESRDIVRWLWREVRGEQPPRVDASAIHRGMTLAMWGLLVAGMFFVDQQLWLWAVALALGTVRSTWTGLRTRSAIHGAIALVSAIGAGSVTLQALGIAPLSWWYVAYALVAVLFVATVVLRVRLARRR